MKKDIGPVACCALATVASMLATMNPPIMSLFLLRIVILLFDCGLAVPVTSRL
jgi:hypothetical protein